jgi:hypothetical protein
MFCPGSAGILPAWRRESKRQAGCQRSQGSQFDSEAPYGFSHTPFSKDKRNDNRSKRFS